MRITNDDIIIKDTALHDLYYFAKYILGYTGLSVLHKDMCSFVQGSLDDVLLLEPRDHFKTTAITISYSIWVIIKNPQVRILINHKVLKKAREILREIKNQFETNAVLRHYFGNYVGDICWTTESIIVKPARTKKEPTISIGAIDHSAASSHYDMIINDDLCGLEDMISEAARETTLRYYKSLKFLHDEGSYQKTITVGTRWHPDDLYGWMLKHIKQLNSRVRSAIIDGRPYFPTRYKIEKLEAMREEDPVMFECQMMNNPIALTDQIYAINELKLFNYESFKPGYQIGYIDPAFGKSERGEPCFFSFPILSIVGDQLYVVDWHTNRNTPEQNEILIVEMIKKHKLRRLGIESNAQQSEFIRNIQRKITGESISIGIESINHSTNKDRRIQGMHGTVKSKVYFREDYAACYKEAMHQLTMYPYSKFKDAPDALEGALSMVMTKKTLKVY